MTTMSRYTIGEFSRITGISAKMLRHYDGMGLLSPEFVGDNLYRYYTDGQVLSGRTIAKLRDVDMPLVEIARLLEAMKRGQFPEDIVLEHMRRLSERIDKDQGREKLCRELIENKSLLEVTMNFESTIKEVKPMQVISVRKIGMYSEIGEMIQQAFFKAGCNCSGAPFVLYHSEGAPEPADMEVCVPVSSGATMTIPGVKALSVIYKGPYSGLGQAYKFGFDQMQAKELKISHPTREIYLTEPNDPQGPVTEILLPFEKM